MASFLQDHNVSFYLGIALTNAGHPTKTARDLKLTRTGDHELLAFAARNRWTFITHNAGDFRLLHQAWLKWADEWSVVPRPVHSGILVLPHPLTITNRVVKAIQSLLDGGESLDNRLFILRHQGDWEEFVATPGKE